MLIRLGDYSSISKFVIQLNNCIVIATSIVSLLRAMRPEQWIKNLFVFAAVFFGGHIFDPEALYASVQMFVAFCLVASSVYLLNDLLDAKEDKLHPKKSKRPIASGSLSKGVALSALFILLLLSLAIPFLGSMVPHPLWASLLLLSYWLLNVAYCFKLKQLALVDVFCIATGFVMRVYAGQLASNIPISKWLFIMTFLLSLFLAFAKRRDDVLILEETGLLMRKSIGQYNLKFLDLVIGLLCAVLLLSYIMYTVSPSVQSIFGDKPLYITALFVLLSLLRYLQLSVVLGKSGSPTHVIYSDRVIQVALLLWILSFTLIRYVF